MVTTMYINTLLLKRLKEAADKIDVTKNDLIALLFSRIIKENRFKPVIFNVEDFHFKPVKYQESIPGIVWKIEHISLEPVFYEKALDLRRHFKFSVSWLISFGIVNYLDELIDEMSNSKDPEKIMDNYDRDSVYIARMLGDVQVFISMLGFPEAKHLGKVLNIV